jgi:Glycosyl hydrolase family 79 C-terminal beta domain
MPRVLGRRARNALVAALCLALPGVVLALPGAPTVAPAAPEPISATVTTQPIGQSMSAGFVGASFEYRAVHQYTGNNPRAVDPVLVNLLRAMSPGYPPVLRIGGNSTDRTWWPIHGTRPPGAVSYGLTGDWLRTTKALAADLGAKLILGINLEAARPAIAAAEGRMLLGGIGRRYIQALEIGNEPDLYAVFPSYRDRRGHLHRSRGRHYSLNDYTREFTRWSHVLPRLPLAGPVTSGPAWMNHLGNFISAERNLKLVTYHLYPLRACVTKPGKPGYPSIPSLLADSSASALARGVTRYASVAHADHRPFRLTELNSASCEGRAGVSDTFASALWALDTLFNLEGAGVDGVNFHMLPGSHYELFSPSQTSAGQWQAFVRPEYYGLLMFAQAFPVGATRLKVHSPGGPVKVWATDDGAGTVRVTVINKDTANAHTVVVHVPGPARGAALKTLEAPAVNATSGVTLGGQSFGPETTTGTLPGPPQTTPVAPGPGGYTIRVPAASAALLTVSSSGGGGSLLRHR